MPRTSEGKTPYAYLDRPHPFSRLAFEAGVGTLGANVQVATNLSNHFNIRGMGNYFSYDIGNFTEKGLTFNPSLTLESAGGALDFYPFPMHGLRFSAGALVHNSNQATSPFTTPNGQTFTLNNNTYYVVAPVTGTGSLLFNNTSPAVLLSTGWGNMISRKGGHLSFPVELGVVLSGKPNLKLAFTGGAVCPGTTTCGTPISVTSYPALQADLNAQINKYSNDLEPLQYYPVISFGIAYNFRIR